MTQPDRLRWIHALARETPDGGCRDWPWAVNSKGYATYKLFGQQHKVGHLILEQTGRERPDPAACQLHSCDRPRCVAPWHLRWGTYADNSKDQVARGRVWHPRGEVNRQAKLNDEAVRAIRASTERYRVLADKYGVHIKTIARVRSGKIWAHVEDVA